jgi:hypothetical protein
MHAAKHQAETGVTEKIGLHVLKSPDGAESGGFALRFSGVIQIPVAGDSRSTTINHLCSAPSAAKLGTLTRAMIHLAGDYVFSIGSNDGSRLSVDGREVVDNDGVHVFTEMSGAVLLSRGHHTFTAEYFYRPGKMLEAVRGGMSFTCLYSLKGEGWMNKGGFRPADIPQQFLFHDVDRFTDSETRVGEGVSLRLAAAARFENRQLKLEQARNQQKIAELAAELAELRAAASSAAEAKREAERKAQLEQIEVARLRCDAHTLQAEVHNLEANALQQVQYLTHSL